MRRRHRFGLPLLGLLSMPFALAGLASGAGARYLVIVSGIGGEEEYRQRFYDWSISMREAARTRLGLPEDHIWYLSEKPEQDPKRIRAKSTKENVTTAFGELAEAVQPGDQLFVLLVGHGSHRSGDSRFNLPGPDITAVEFAQILERFAQQEVVFVNTSSASGDFVPVLSGKNRIVVTATKTGLERNETVFGKYFVQAYAEDGADADKNGRVSVLEAFEYARTEVARSYEEDNRLLTEHAVLDDNGDGVGAQRFESEPRASAGAGRGGGAAEVAEGRLAGVSFLGGAGLGGARAATMGPAADQDPEVAALHGEMQALEGQIQALKGQKETMPSDLYLKELEKLLLELARKNRAMGALKRQESQRRQ
ncbi:MAG: C13 family peptidase [Acidobacteriota bacterium]